MFDEDARDADDREHLARMAQQEQISRRLARVNARATLRLLDAIEDEQERAQHALDARAAVAVLVPLLPAAVKLALSSTGLAEMTLREAAGALGLPVRPLARLLRTGGTFPMPFTREGRHVRFRRVDVLSLLGEDDAPAEGVVELAAAIGRALPTQGKRHALVPTAEAAEALDVRPTQLARLVESGRAPLKAIRFGRKLFFRSRDVDALVARASTLEHTTSDEEESMGAPFKGGR